MKLSLDEKTFLDRVSFRLFSNPLKWRQLVSQGMTHEEVLKYFVDLTKQQRAQAKEKKNDKGGNFHEK
jgi:hypothetical protein